MALRVILNGQAKGFEGLMAGASLTDAIAALGLKPDRVAVERNGEIVGREAWVSTPLGDGDKLEIVHFVGGGV